MITNQPTTTMEYTLKCIETGNKAPKYNYVIMDANGNIMRTINSNRKYVACTIDGYICFGRLDLIGKGNHARFIKEGYNMPIAYIKN